MAIALLSPLQGRPALEVRTGSPPPVRDAKRVRGGVTTTKERGEPRLRWPRRRSSNPCLSGESSWPERKQAAAQPVALKPGPISVSARSAVPAAATGASAVGAGHGAAAALGVENRKRPRAVLAPATPAGDRDVGLGDRAQGVETFAAVEADVLVNRHGVAPVPRRGRISYTPGRLPSGSTGRQAKPTCPDGNGGVRFRAMPQRLNPRARSSPPTKCRRTAGRRPP